MYLVALNSTIRMVLVHNNNKHNEHVIYYLSTSLVGTKLCYVHVKKLALVVHEVKCCWNYILCELPLSYLMPTQCTTFFGIILLGEDTQNGLLSYRSLT